MVAVKVLILSGSFHDQLVHATWPKSSRTNNLTWNCCASMDFNSCLIKGGFVLVLHRLRISYEFIYSKCIVLMDNVARSTNT